MKTQKDIEKEIEALTKENHTKYYDDSYGYDIEINNDKKIEDLKALLQQSKEFVERIEKLKNRKPDYTTSRKRDVNHFLEELKSSITGSEERK